jgi:DNA topoisomerase-1
MARRIVFPAAPAPEELAKLARLRYVSDEEPGFTRRRSGSGFMYLNTRGDVLRDPKQLARIKSLVIPPAWQDVWICPHSTGHIQVTGRDARGRKQYMYHERWQHVANLVKFVRMEPFGQILPNLRAALHANLAGRKLTRTRVLSGVLALLDLTAIRVGSEEYVKENKSYGLTTLRDRHVTINSKGAELRFRAKAGVKREAFVEDKPLARLIAQCAEVKGAHLFQYVDEAGRNRAVTAGEVNDYLKEITGHPFTAKDFRTWKGSVRAASRLYEARDVLVKTKRKRIVRETICEAAEALGNTPAICRNYYIHPELLTTYEEGLFPNIFNGYRPRRQKHLMPEEPLFARFLRQWKPAPPP